MPSKGDELYEARDLRIVPVDSPDPEVRTNLRGSPGLKAVFILASGGGEPVGRKQNGTDSLFLTRLLYAVFPFCQIYRPITAMVFDRNLRFTIDLNDFPEFSRVRLWTPGISENAGMIRAHAQIRSGTRKEAFLNRANISERTYHPSPSTEGIHEGRTRHGPDSRGRRCLDVSSAFLDFDANAYAGVAWHNRENHRGTRQ